MRHPFLRAVAALALLFSLAMSLPAVHADVMDSYTFVHDPTMLKQGSTYYLYSTGDPQGGVNHGNIQIRTTTDLRHWHFRGTVFAEIPGWITKAVGPIPNLWAPDISYFGGVYHLYYAGSTFGTSNSVIGLATSPTLVAASKAYHWTDHGLVLRSTRADDYNAIDPSLVTDAAGHHWLVFGSFWSGIKLIAISNASGKPVAGAKLVSLAFRPGSNAVEAPVIAYHAPYYYLFVSFDRCCQGVNSTYRIMVGRARAVSGPYLDQAGVAMTKGGATQVLASNGDERGPGGQSVVRDGRRMLLVYHYYDGKDNGNAKGRVRSLTWTSDGWPRAGAVLSAP
jgi:arabinan endo-1,5-alpha-L-arabinosidase